MTAMAMGARPARVGRPFYLVMGVAMAAVIVAGFSQTVPDDFKSGLPLLLHLHGAVFTLWVMLVVVQPSLVAKGALALHRKVGWAGAVLAAAMVIMGVAATLFALSHKMVPPFFPGGVFLVMNMLGILVFGALVAAGIARRRDGEWHKRLMLCATVSILGPGLGRFLPMQSFGAAAPLVMFGINDLFALAGPVADLVVTRRVHPAYYWGVGSILAMELAIGPLAFSPPVAALVHMLRGG